MQLLVFEDERALIFKYRGGGEKRERERGIMMIKKGVVVGGWLCVWLRVPVSELPTG